MTNDDDNFFNIITKSLMTLCLSSFANSDLSLPFTGKQDKKKGRWCGVARWQYRINKLLKYTSFAEHFLWIWETKLLKEGRLLLRRFCQVKCGFVFGMTVMPFLCRGVWFHQNFNKRLYKLSTKVFISLTLAKLMLCHSPWCYHCLFCFALSKK